MTATTYYWEVGAKPVNSGSWSPFPPKSDSQSVDVDYKKEYKNQISVFDPVVWPTEYTELPLSGDSL